MNRRDSGERRAPAPRTWARLVARRLAAQEIGRTTFRDPAALIAHLGAVQAQDLAASRWAVGLRLGGRRARESDVAGALAAGRVLRTHVMRWTWQLVTPADLSWMLPLVAARLIARAARRHRELGLDAAIFYKSGATLARALEDGVHRTRAELAAVLREAGVAVDGARLSHLLGHAELQAILCSGAPRGTQPTYALLAARAPGHGRPLTRAEALAELARRYFRSRGPATAADFTWWSGLQPAEARAGLEAVGDELAAETDEGATTWSDPRVAGLPPAALARAHLLPAFDEYLVAYRDRGALIAPADMRRLNAGGGMLRPVIVVGGRVIGGWRRTLAPDAVTIQLEPFARMPVETRHAVEEAAARYAAFLGRTPQLVWRRA